MTDGYFGEEIAANYDADTSGMHDDSVTSNYLEDGDGVPRMCRSRFATCGPPSWT